MLHFSKWKAFSAVAIVLAGFVMALPNVLSEQTRSMIPGFLPSTPVTLGLDLQGGSHVLLEVDKVDLRQTLAKQLRGDIRQTLWLDRKIKHTVAARGNGSAVVRISDPAKVEEAFEALQTLSQSVNTGFFNQGADVQEMEFERQGDAITISFSETGLEQKISRAVEQSLEIIGRRINALGTTEPTIQRQGVDRILVQVPGLQDPERLKTILGQTAKLTFQLLCESQRTSADERVPVGCDELVSREGGGDYWVQTSRRATVDGADLVDAQPAFDSRNGEPIVTFRFNTKGAQLFGRLTQANVNRPFAIVLDKEVMSAPVINEPILGGTGQISGNFSVEEVNDLAIVLRSGALPAKLEIVEERTVGPSLGSDSVRAGFIACVIGLIAVLIFMIVTYGLFGVFANIALISNLLLLIGVLSLLQATLTLPGIAGIVLTLGMAVDSNVLVFERIREEVRNGRSPLNAIETGFSKALGTILDANITTFIAAVILFGLGSGPIRGFAVTLGLGIMTTVFTAYTLTRLIVAWWVRQSRPKTVPL